MTLDSFTSGTVSELAQLPEAETEGEVGDDLDGVTIPHLECPRDGTILDDSHQFENAVGTYECLRCHDILKIWEVFQER